MFRRFLPLLALFLLTSCSLLEEPPRPVLPTPMATAPTFDFDAAAPGAVGEVIYNPVSSVIPGIDPTIAALLDQVSQQQLMGYVQTLEGFGSRNVFGDVDDPMTGIGATRQWIFDEFVRVGNGRLQVTFDEFPLSYNGIEAPLQRNVIATLPGTDPDADTIIVLAHYDSRLNDIYDGYSRQPAADDNASGVALLLETARVLSSQEWNQTIIIAAMAGEEEGSVGAHHYVQQAFLDGITIDAAINYDTVGGRVGIPQSIRLFAPQLETSAHGELGRYYDFVGEMYQPTFPVTIINATDRDGRFGDQREFIAAGMPAIRLTESEEDPTLLNSTKDSWELIDYAYLQQVTRLNVAVLANILGAPARPAAPTVAAMEGLGAYLLTWEVDPAADGYVLLFRPLASPDYTPFRFVSKREAGNVAVTDLDLDTEYAVSIAPVMENGRFGLFSPEIIVGTP